ncbi:hypothetical protein IFM89_001370 [Coptis chinensis]|uniref:Pentatricopeptide repeat-containing protein n=1 Tax=Coptis chinensis TaxID=261450 RepID=A0A835HK95_9MAGN|nr:hypothetical protein IFM89_001370 [Coptis chinensis]
MLPPLLTFSAASAAFGETDGRTERSVRSWTAMIAGYVQCGNLKEAIRMFTDMEAARGTPNEVIVVAVLASCADLGALDFEIARDVFYEMKERTVVSWSAMFGGYAMHDQAEEALKLFSKMSRIGIRPNGVAFIGLLHACSHMGLVDEGCGFFSSMTRDYEIIPQIEHYGCMVDLLSSGAVAAFNVVKTGLEQEESMMKATDFSSKLKEEMVDELIGCVSWMRMCNQEMNKTIQKFVDTINDQSHCGDILIAWDSLLLAWDN